MKQIIVVLLAIVIVIGLIVAAFTIDQVSREDQRLKSDLENRSTILADSLKETVEPNFKSNSDIYLQTVLEKLVNQERFAGLGVYDNKGQMVAVSSNIPEATVAAQKVVAAAMDSDRASSDFAKFNKGRNYLFAVPLHDDKSVVGALLVVQNAGYIDDRLAEIWHGNLLRLIVQASLLSVAILFLIRWIIFALVKNLVENLKMARTGSLRENPPGLKNSFLFGPLANEVTNIRRSLIEARSAASEEAKLRLEELDSPWTAQRLKEFLKDILEGRKIFMVSNREPYIHFKNGRKIDYFFPASGMATAIEPIMQACGGMWLAHGSGNADKLVVNQFDKIKVPPDEPKYTLKRIWLTPDEEIGYYNGFCNEGIWPLCHIAHVRPTFRKEDWEQYKRVNIKFAESVLLEIKNLDRPIVLIQDFHLALVPRIIKNQKPNAIVGLFWHIPWPNSESFSICPWKKEILDGMLGADLLGFHTQLHCNNFIETVGRELESLIDFERFTVAKGNHITWVKPFPISIAFPNGFHNFENIDHKIEGEKILKNLKINTKNIGLGIDRLDYTKGILERLKAIEIFLSKYPNYIGSFSFIQVGAPSRNKIKKYQEFAQEVRDEVGRINSMFKSKRWQPIVLLERHHSHQELDVLYKLASFCMVTSLHDGMNLVAKEYVAASEDNRGVLILSQYTGASRELKDAIIANPYNGEQTAEAIKEALEMPESEQIKKMKAMREVIKNNNVYRWSAELLKAMVNLG